MFNSFGIYGLANLLNAGIPFLLLPILTRYLDPGSFGLVALFQTLVSIGVACTGLSLNGAVGPRWINRDVEPFQIYFGNALVLMGFFGLSNFVILFVARDLVCALTGFPAEWVWAVCLATTCMAVSSAFMALLQAQEKPYLFAVFQVGSSIVNLALSLFLIVSIGMSWQGRIVGQLTGLLFVVGGGIWLIQVCHLVTWRINRREICYSLTFALPLIPHALAGWALSQSDRLMVSSMVGLAATGLLLGAAQISMTLTVFNDAVIKSWVPWFYQRLKEDSSLSDGRIVNVTWRLTAIMFTVAIIVSISSPWLIRFVLGSTYEGCIDLVPWIVLGNAFDGAYALMAGYYFYFNRTSKLFLVTLTSSIATLAFIYIGISHNGVIGATQGTLAGKILCFLLAWRGANGIRRMPWFFFSPEIRGRQ